MASALQNAKKAVADALGDDYWPDSEIPEEMLNETYGVSADLYDAYLGECPHDQCQCRYFIDYSRKRW